MTVLRSADRSIARIVIACALALTGAAAAEASRRPVERKVSVERKSDRECLARAMYFESRRTDGDGMLAVGTVVANRLAAGGRYGESVCEVVGKAAQFAPGVLRRAMTETRPRELAYDMAEAVLEGERHPVAGRALYFHTDAAPFRHDDKRYVLVAGGNAFYEWNRVGGRARISSNLISLARARASAPSARDVAAPVVADAVSDADHAAVAVLASSDTLRASASGAAPAPSGPIVAALPAPAILAYAAPVPSPVAGGALAAVAALEPKRPRVVVPGAPVQAAAGPVWPVRSGAENGARAWSPGELANAAVEKAWALFQAVRR